MINQLKIKPSRLLNIDIEIQILLLHKKKGGFSPHLTLPILTSFLFTLLPIRFQYLTFMMMLYKLCVEFYWDHSDGGSVWIWE